MDREHPNKEENVFMTSLLFRSICAPSCPSINTVLLKERGGNCLHTLENFVPIKQHRRWLTENQTAFLYL